MSYVPRLPALRTWLKVHLTALVVVQALVIGLGVASNAPVAAAADAAPASTTTTSAPSSTSTTSTTVAVTTTSAPEPTTTTTAAPAPPTTRAPAPAAPAPAPPPAPAPAAPAPPFTSSPDEQELFADHNNRRASAGVAPLQSDPCLAAAARRWAAEMAARGELSHQPDLGGVVGACVAWNSAGENVGRANSAAQLAALFWDHSVHRANITASNFTMVGIGVVVDSNGQRWACVLFAG